MYMGVFSVFDSKANAFLQPWFSVNSAVAIRMFEAACNDETQDFFRFASDYTLFEIGSFNADSGLITPCAAPISLGVAITFVRKGVS